MGNIHGEYPWGVSMGGIHGGVPLQVLYMQKDHIQAEGEISLCVFNFYVYL